MIKINFEDLPSEDTPINATNLNQVQTNVENEFTTTNGKIDTEKLNLQAEIQQKIQEALFFKADETLYIDRYYTGGFVTTGRTDILFSVPMPKRLDNVTPSITAGKITIRDVSGNYLKQVDDINNASVTIYKEKGWINLLLRYSNALSTTNNTPVAIYIQDVTVSFN